MRHYSCVTRPVKRAPGAAHATPAAETPGAPAWSRPPTIKDVAERAGVSKSLVSRVMRGEDAVSARAREAVEAAAQELGYRPNAVARSLVQQRTFNVGVMVSDLHNLFFAEILDGIDEVAAACGYRMLITTGNRVRDAEAEALETLLQLRADGVILLAPRLPFSVVARAGAAAPMAIVGSWLRVPGVDTVVNDDVRGAELAVEHLVGLGHGRIGMVDGGDGAGAAERRTGYESAMRRLGLAGEILVARGDFTEEGGYRGARQLLACDPPPTAIFAGNDLAAVGALNAIEEAGLSVPGSVSLVGYDNTALASLRHVSLTTVHQPRREIGQMAMKALLRRIDGAESRGRRVVLDPRLIDRETTAPPPA
jgi:DNA-binding LacI/PurR family transcriptional regulator